jgi:hypothetical protein
MAIAVVYGNKLGTMLAGFAADYCAICRDIREFAVHQLTTVSHVYWIPTSSPKAVGCVAQCTTCGTCIAVNPQCFAALAIAQGSELSSLIDSTNPAALQERDERKRIEAAAREGALPEQARVALISEPFQLLAPLVEDLYARRQRRGSGQSAVMAIASVFSPIHVVDTAPTGTLAPAATICLLVAMFVPLGLLAAGMVSVDRGPAPKWSWISALVVLSISIYGIAKFQSLRRARVLRERVLPLLACSLRCLNPTLEEVRQTMQSYAANGLRIGSAFEAEDLCAASNASEDG